MANFLVRAIGGKALGQAKGRGWLNVPLGIALLKDRRVPVGKKLFAVGLGLALTAGLAALELPLETILAALLPFAGVALDVLFDGAEFILLPFVFAAIFLPHLCRKSIQAAAPVPPRLQ